MKIDKINYVITNYDDIIIKFHINSVFPYYKYYCLDKTLRLPYGYDPNEVIKYLKNNGFDIEGINLKYV